MLVTKQSKNSKLAKTILLTIAIGLIILNGGFDYLYIRQYVAIGDLIEKESASAISQNFGEIYRTALKNQPVYITLPGAERIRARVEDYTKPSSIWALVNKTHPIPEDYEPSNLQIASVNTRSDKSDNERSVRSDIDQALQDMFSDAMADGYDLMIGSGYRPASLQALYFYNLAASVGEDSANQSIARPGQSEHQTGLATDISTTSRNCYLDNCFAETNDGKWLADNSYKYGFILRYPEDKTDITGYMYESWHFRYVGIDLATAIYQSGLTLDEAWPYLEEAQAILMRHHSIE